MKSLVSAALLASAVLAQTGQISINPKAKLLQDGVSRSVIFHGVNVVYKVHPYIP